MLNIICVNAGNYLGNGVEYTNILANMVARNISKETVYKFICFTDTPGEYDCEIDVRPLPVEGLNGWWNKIGLFKDGIFPDGDRILYLDLDTAIVAGLDDVIKYDGDFAILRDFHRPNGLQSSVMMWRANTQGKIWEYFEDDGYPNIVGGDQVWIEKCEPKHQILQFLYPGAFVSYKLHALREIPKAAKMVIFHGHPRPDEIINGWVPYVWKVGGGTMLELTNMCNTKQEALIANIRHALTLRHPWLQMMPAHDGHAVIVGGGPSLKKEIGEIKKRQEHGQVVFSTNNTYKYLWQNGIFADCHVMVDARAENKEFVPGVNIPCYYASQCHPDVLNLALNVILWHTFSGEVLDVIGDDTGDPLVGAGTTVGLKAIAIAHILGYRNIHLYGFDSSYEDGDNHAYKQPLNDGERTLEVEMNGKKYKAAAWMCSQVEEFKEVARELVNSGCILTVHGYGLLPDVVRTITTSVPAAHVRAHEILTRLNVPNPVGAEIGVFTGALSQKLLERGDLTLYMVDSWATCASDSEYAKSGDFHAALSQERQDRYFESTCRAVQFAGDKAKIIRKPSVEAAAEIEDRSLDFVFIDADHSYEGCKADISAWASKVKPGGLLCGHDYNNVEYPCFGVNQAVDEFSKSTGLPMETGDNFTWFIRLAA